MRRSTVLYPSVSVPWMWTSVEESYVFVKEYKSNVHKLLSESSRPFKIRLKWSIHIFFIPSEITLCPNQSFHLTFWNLHLKFISISIVVWILQAGLLSLWKDWAPNSFSILILLILKRNFSLWPKGCHCHCWRCCISLFWKDRF